MPLRDHFRSPVDDTHSWDEVHGGWPMEIVRQLVTILPKGYRAAPQVHLGSTFEVDVGSYELDTHDPNTSSATSNGLSTQVLESPTLTIESDLPEQDEYEVRIYDTKHGRTLVATIEIISPSNKDRPQHRSTFVSKALALLKQGVSVSIVDLVTIRQANLYVELLAALGHTDPKLGDPPPSIYAVTLRTRDIPRRRPLTDAWFYPMRVGSELPTIPIWLSNVEAVTLPLEVGYETTCGVLGIQ